jgi:hypothetical protein
VWDYENNRRTMLLTSGTCASFEVRTCIFGLIQKCTKKIKAVKKKPDNFLHSAEISQTLPTAVGIKHEKFRALHFGNCPGGCSSRPKGASVGPREASLEAGCVR